MTAGKVTIVHLGDGRQLRVAPSGLRSGVFLNDVFFGGWTSVEAFIKEIVIPTMRAVGEPVVWTKEEINDAD